jgi:hypothetical protein
MDSNHSDLDELLHTVQPRFFRQMFPVKHYRVPEHVRFGSSSTRRKNPTPQKKSKQDERLTADVHRRYKFFSEGARAIAGRVEF